MSGMSRRDFGRLATEVGLLGLTGTLAACAAPSAPPRSAPTQTQTQSQTQTPIPVPGNRTRPIKLTQADLDRIIGDQAHALLDRLRSKVPARNYGVAVAFAYPDRQFDRFYMYGTVADRTPPTERTLFGIASITKTFTTALFANGVELRPGCFDWDAGMQHYLGGYLGNSGEVSATMQQITPRMLAQHTSGLDRNLVGPQDGDGLYLDNPSAAPPGLLELWRTHSNPRPGSCWVYSNLGFVTLGFATVSAYGCGAGGTPPGSPSYAELLHDQITGPLNMPDTMTIVPDGAALIDGHNNGHEVPLAATADIKSSATDMHTWLLAHLGAANGPPALMKALATTTQHSSLSVPVCGKSTRAPANMGLAWQFAPGPPKIIWKDGLTTRGGCSSWVGFTPPGPTQEPLGIAILINGYWNNEEPEILADSYGASMLKQISAAI
jgi:CubicO group peptidase (beta-lactamase class C family)